MEPVGETASVPARVVHFDGRLPLAAAALAVVFGLLVIAGRADYLAYHSVIEFLVASVAFAFFAISWNTRELVDDDFPTVLGVCLLVEAGAVVLHALAYQGMAVFPSATATMGSQFWIVARAILAAGLIAAPHFIGRKIERPLLVVALFGVPVVLAVVAIFERVFPVTFVSGVGLTPFKIGAEWAIMAGLALGWWLLWRKRDRFEGRVFTDLSIAIGCMIAAELVFTAYTSLTDIFNVVGHILHLFSFYFVYRALVARTLEDPLSVLFRRLSQREGELREENRFSEGLNRITADISSWLSADEILAGSLASATAVAGADGAVVSLKEDEDRFRVRYAHGAQLQDATGMLLDRATAPHVFRAASTQDPVIVGDVDADDQAGSGVKRFGTRALLSIPLIMRGDTIGVMSLHWTQPSATVSSPRLVLFARKLGAALSLALANAKLYESEHKVAETLQSAMAASIETSADVEIGSVYRSAPGIGRIGGDFFDVFDLADGSVAFLLGDVSGKGIEAAATGALARSTLRALAYRDPDPAGVLEEASEALLRQLGDAEFVTVAFGILDPVTSGVSMGLAGHPDAIVCGRRDLVPPERRDPPLAAMPGTTYSDWRFTLGPGEALVLFSDGICEARRGGEMFGVEGVRRLLDTCREESCQQVADKLLAEVERFDGGTQRDDIAILVLRPRRGAASTAPRREGKP